MIWGGGGLVGWAALTLGFGAQGSVVGSEARAVPAWVNGLRTAKYPEKTALALK